MRHLIVGFGGWEKLGQVFFSDGIYVGTRWDVGVFTPWLPRFVGVFSVGLLGKGKDFIFKC